MNPARHLGFCALCFLCTCASASGARADVAKVFKSVGDLSQVHEGSPFVIEGVKPADPKKWEATLWSQNDGKRCTATIIGARVVLTAAHCLEKGPTIAFEAKGKSYFADCVAASRYQTDKSADYALCLVRSAVSDIVPEKLALQADELGKAKTLTLAGYGCTQFPHPMFIGFQIGTSTIWKRPGDIAGSPNTLQTRGGASLCLGDSGGGAYLIRKPSNTRRLAAINAKMGAEAPDGVPVSGFASVSTSSFYCFASDWFRKNSAYASMAGISPTASSQCPL